jgi:hypothetical protein
MPRNEVYSWRLTTRLKHRLQARAREEGVSVADLLERIAGEWLQERGGDDDSESQARLHAAAEAAIGTIAGGDPSRSGRARQIVAERVRAHSGRRRRSGSA